MRSLVRRFSVWSLPAVLLVPALATLAHAAPVLMISIDGLKPEYVTQADAKGMKVPYLRSMMRDGAYAEGVVGVWPTVTYPSHTTLLTGVAPALSPPRSSHKVAASENHFVHVAPDPILARLDGLHQGVMRGVKVFGGVLVLGGIATAHVAALQTRPQVHPAISHFEALLATGGARFRSRTLFQVITMFHRPLDCQYTRART